MCGMLITMAMTQLSLGCGMLTLECGMLTLECGMSIYGLPPLPPTSSTRHSAIGGRRSAITICICNIPVCLFDCQPSAVGGLRSAIGGMCKTPKLRESELPDEGRRTATGDRRSADGDWLTAIVARRSRLVYLSLVCSLLVCLLCIALHIPPH